MCVTDQCEWARFPLLLWELLDQAAAVGPGADRNPAGRPRPQHRGLVVPWVTPVTEHGPHWRLMHRGRLAAAQQDWLCQVCGLAADPDDSVLVVNPEGWCLTSAPLHPGACTSEATSWCPAIARAGRVARIRRGDEQRSGWICPEFGSTQRWRIDPAMLNCAPVGDGTPGGAQSFSR